MDKVKDFIDNVTMADFNTEGKTENSVGTKMEQIQTVLSRYAVTKDVAEDGVAAALALLVHLPKTTKAEFVSMFTLVIPMEWIERTYTTYQLSTIKDLETSLDTVSAFASLCTAIKLSPIGIGSDNDEILWLAFTGLCMINRFEGAADIVIPMVEEMPDELFAKLIQELAETLHGMEREIGLDICP